MKREEFIKWAESRGWKMDRFGHLKPESAGTSEYRYKLSRVSVRLEVKSGLTWYRLRSGYFSKLSISPDGKLVGLTR